MTLLLSMNAVHNTAEFAVYRGVKTMAAAQVAS
jgi:hypothetical protein